MLIRNALLKGYPGLTDLRLMHGAVQEIGVGLRKGLYESELDLAGDELSPCPPDFPLPRSFRRKAGTAPYAGDHIIPGTPSPLIRWRNAEPVEIITEHSAD